MQQVGGLAAQGVNQLPSRRTCVTEQVDYGVGMEPHHPQGEGTVPVFPLTVNPDLLDGAPGRVIEIRTPLLTAHCHHLMSSTREAGHEVATDVAE